MENTQLSVKTAKIKESWKSLQKSIITGSKKEALKESLLRLLDSRCLKKTMSQMMTMRWLTSLNSIPNQSTMCLVMIKMIRALMLMNKLRWLRLKHKNSKQRKTEHTQIKTLTKLPQLFTIREVELWQILMTKKCSLATLGQSECLLMKHLLKQHLSKYLQRRSKRIWNLKIFYSAMAIEINIRLQNKISHNRMSIFIKIHNLLLRTKL